MAKLRLNMTHRDALYAEWKKLVKEDTDLTTQEQLFSDFIKGVENFYKEKYPQKDMKILAKYDCIEDLSKDSYLYCNKRGESRHVTFEKGLLSAKIPCRNDRLVLTDELADKYDEWELEKDKNSNCINDRLNPVYSLIYNTRYLEDVLEVVPALKDVVVRGSTALAVVSKELLVKIKKDPLNKAA